MENILFSRKLSFAAFVWLAILATVTLNFSSASHTLVGIEQEANKALEQVKSLASIYKDVRTAAVNVIITQAQATPERVAPAPIPKDGLQCMAENIYYEAATQSYAGKIAVGQVVLNRLKAPGYPNTICGVIYEGSHNEHTTQCQFSWTCAPHNGIDKKSLYWEQSLNAAKELLSRKDMVDITEGATAYHADYVSPKWSKTLQFVTQIDQHIFYRH
jgi:spore germination cell wall hydrolase CwlJ-like protein